MRTPKINAVLKDWHLKTDKLKKQFTQLVDSDLQCFDGEKQKMLDKLQIKLGKTKEELHAIIAKL